MGFEDFVRIAVTHEFEKGKFKKLDETKKFTYLIHINEVEILDANDKPETNVQKEPNVFPPKTKGVRRN